MAGHLLSAVRPRRPLRQCRRTLSGENGQSTVETGLALLLTFSLAFLFFEASMLVYSYTVINNAAQEGVRYAVVHGSDSSNCSGAAACDPNGTNVKAIVNSYAATCLHDISGMSVLVTYPDPTANKPLSLVVVKVTFPYVPYFRFPALTSTLQLTSQGRIVF